MKKTNKKLITYAFIDSQNLNLGVRSQGWRLDFTKFRILLSEKYLVKKAFLFIGFIPKNKELYAKLEKDGFILIFKPVIENKIHPKVKIKGNVDAELVLHAMIQYPHYQKAIIVSGDGDFYCLVEYLYTKRKLAKVIVPSRKYSSLLRKYSNSIVNISLFKRKLA